MPYAETLQRSLAGFRPHPDHLYLLEAFQIEELPDRLPARDLAALLLLNPTLRRVWALRHPPFEARVAPLLQNQEPTIADLDDVLWEIADLLVAVAAPDLLDSRSENADVTAVTEAVAVEGLVVDAGAGTGRLSFALARHAATVYAIEPVSALRTWIRLQSRRIGASNVRVADGFLHDLPFPEHTVDVVVTRRAIGWRLHAEIAEIERVLVPGGGVVHLTGIPVDQDAGDLHPTLVDAGYRLAPYREGRLWCRRYVR
jgi:SAM-dependent methyltransferase